MDLTQLLLEYQFLTAMMNSLVQARMQNADRLKKFPQNVNDLALKEKLLHDREILMPKIEELHGKLKDHYQEVWGVEFQFI